MKDLKSVKLKEGQKDSWIWEASSDGLFSVRSCYESLLELTPSENHVFF